MEKKYDFGEKATEFSAKDGKEIPVWKSPKYEQSKKAVIEMLKSNQYKDVLDVSDFWILMNRTKNGKMAYTGLIISHNGCLKINDVLPEELKFNPKCVSWTNDEQYNESLVFSYDSSLMGEKDKQRIFEIGEVSSKNCTNDYPYAMALKRCMDRVILKNSKLAYSGVYSDSEAEEFKNNNDDNEEKQKEETPKSNISSRQELINLCEDYNIDINEIAKKYKLNAGSKKEDFAKAVIELQKEINQCN